MKPWFAAVTLTELPLLKSGYNPNYGVEPLLKAQANAEGDKVVGFETFEQQLQLLDRLPEADQIAFLIDTLGDVEKVSPISRN